MRVKRVLGVVLFLVVVLVSIITNLLSSDLTVQLWYTSYRTYVWIGGFILLFLAAILTFFDNWSGTSEATHSKNQSIQDAAQHLNADTMQGNTIVQASRIENLHVQSPPSQAEDFKVEDAVRIDYTYNKGLPSYIVQNFDPNQNISHYIDYDKYSPGRFATKEGNYSIISTSPTLSIDVVSQVDLEWVKVAPFVVVDVVSIESMDDVVNYCSVELGMGGAGVMDYFNATLAPGRRISGAPRSKLDPNTGLENRVDHYDLQPGERASLLVVFAMVAGYYYHFRVGIQYSCKGEIYTKCIDEIFVAAKPVKANVWHMNLADDIFVYDRLDENVSKYNNEQRLISDMHKDALKVNSHPIFKIPTLGCR